MDACHGDRAGYVQHVRFVISFPPPAWKSTAHTRHIPEMPCRETKEDLAENDELFTRQIRGLFDVLSKIQKDRGETRPGGIELLIYIRKQDVTEARCDHRRYHNWRVHLLKPEDLPTIKSVRALTLNPERSGKHHQRPIGERPLDLRILVDLVCKFPNLETLDCPYLYERFMYPYMFGPYSRYCQPWTGPWRDSRHDFARAMKTALSRKALPGLFKRATFHFFDIGKDKDTIDNGDFRRNLVHPEAEDPLSSAVRALSQKLEELDLRIMADSALFWPTAEMDNQEGPATSLAPSWPRLKQLHVELHPYGPNGKRYFQHPRMRFEDDEPRPATEVDYPPMVHIDSDMFADQQRLSISSAWPIVSKLFWIEPDRETLEPVLESFARALACMGALEEAELFFWLIWNEENINLSIRTPEVENTWMHRWGVKYTRTKMQSGSLKKKLEWQVGKWRPSASLSQAFRALGPDVEEEWKELENHNRRPLSASEEAYETWICRPEPEP